MSRADSHIANAARAVVVVATGEQSEATARALHTVDPDCVVLGIDASLALLRSRPFTVRAMVIAGDGESLATRALLAAVKEFAPRLPIVFLDERDSTTSELNVRRTGVHYYTHAPATTNEISAVLHGLMGGVLPECSAAGSQPVK